MAKPILMPTYHEAVIEALRSLSWVNNADDYPEQATQITTPAVFFSIMGWEQSPSNDGQLNVEFECDLFVVIDKASNTIDKPQIYARSAAADISQWINGQTFGLEGLQPAAFISAGPDSFDPAMDDYIVWRITYSQSAAMGEDPFESVAGPLREVWLGAAPDIGAAHINDYRLIYKRKEE